MKKEHGKGGSLRLEHPKIKEALNVINHNEHDLFEQEKAKSHLSDLSVQHLEEYLETENSSNNDRLVLFEVALRKKSSEIVACAINEAFDKKKEIGHRRSVLGLLSHKQGGDISDKNAKELITAFQTSLLEEKDLSFLKLGFTVFQNWGKHFVRKEALAFLEDVAARHAPPVRSFALVVMGSFGGLDILERVQILSSNDPRDQKAVDSVIEALRKKPIDVSLLTPEGFEHLMAALFRKKGYTGVKKTRLYKDGGVDITAISPTDGALCLIQCKRYKPDHLVRQKDVKDLDQSVFSHRVKQPKLCAIFVTTATGQAEDALDYLGKRGQEWPFEYIGGVDLQKELDQHFGKGKFFLRGELSALQSANFDLFE